jgi:hypothetical protein
VSEDGPPPRRRVHRGEGEVTQWPRGLVDYVAKGPDDEDPSVEEDRTANRLRLAARLLAVLRAQGRDIDREVGELREAERAFSEGDRALATQLVDRLFADLDERRSSERPDAGP